jgi:signal transduction histidine kinase
VRLLGDLARQIGVALHAVQLTEELQASRERIVISREEERRRIRNDLHDGLGPTLSALQLQLGAMRNLIRKDPDQAEAIANELRDDLRQATAEIRQLVYDLRPPLLDELGLVEAIKSCRVQASEIKLEVIAPEPMPRLSAALEVAIYRIASEAIHNVIRHAQASECIVCLEVGDAALKLVVADNGKGLPDAAHVGVGLLSMNERAAELGGMLSILPGKKGGVEVLALFPMNE